MKSKVVLVGWVSVGAKAAPYVTVLADATSPYAGRVSELYLCWRRVEDPSQTAERDAFELIRTTLREQLGAHCPKIQSEPWDTDSEPIDHGAILAFAKPFLRRVREDHPTREIVLHLSPGTPSIHAIWLLLGTTAHADENLTLIQTRDRTKVPAGTPLVQKVQFRIDSYLKRFRATQPARSGGSDDDGHLWDPDEVQSPVLIEALAKLSEWARLRAPVLLIGERGSGKTTLAHYLRSVSPFQKDGAKTWPVVVCGQFRANPDLARSELFGHKAGAFTGATTERKGLLQAADGDSIFFDEIADIDRGTQRLLMGAFEDGGFTPLGDSKVVHSRFRLITATNRSLEELRMSCDDDFFDRVAVFVLEIPPLRACRQDLPRWWARTLGRAAGDSQLDSALWQPYATDAAVLALLANHPLPGNFRDLQRAALHLLAAAIPKDGRGRAQERSECLVAVERGLGRSSSASTTTFSLPLEGGLEQHLLDYEGKWHDAALAQAKGNISEAARLLGVNRRTFDGQVKAVARKRGGERE